MAGFISFTTSGKDNHSGYYHIPTGISVVIETNKQMVFFGSIFTIDGALVVDGQMIMEY